MGVVETRAYEIPSLLWEQAAGGSGEAGWWCGGFELARNAEPKTAFAP
ncbi:MAG: hypothetical protein COC24_002395 [Alphaproteobacteria bacterium]|nr:hypothetical protein [Alphaproteobacteria bacterium]